MGASTWRYFTPYHPKPAVALRHLRQQVFAAGEYRRPATGRERIAQARGLPSAADAHRQTAANLRAQAALVRQNPAAYDTPDLGERMRALFREMRRALAPGSPIEQLIAFYESEATRSEQMAAAAEAEEPRVLRLLDAVQADSAASLSAAEVHEFERFRQLRAASPTLRRQFSEPGPPVGSIDELLEQAGEAGTHSILDIIRVGRRAAHATAFPLRPDLLVSTFGTAEPTRAQVEGSELAFAEGLTWQAVYFAVYQNGSPVEWAFVGSTGD
jgi:hypothetical protein